jgi:LmbE family N-acetylglucosaminyl deacetylase
MPDHTAVSKLVFDAAFAATVPHYPCGDLEATTVVPIFYMETASGIGFVPTEYVDITDEMPLKQEMFACHESQVKWLMDHDGVDTSEKMETFARFHGYQCGVKYAEVFRRCEAGLKMTPNRLLP